MTDLHALTICEAGRLIKEKKLSPVELTRALLERIEAVDHRLKSYITVLPESALAEARAAEEEVLRGRYRGPLHGIPLAHKDVFDTKGVRTTAQSKALEHRIPREDATAVARLREAGAILLGKMAMYEFALAGPQTSLGEPARNLWDLNRLTGGSSSGSAVAVAAGLCMGSLGTDTGASIRSPASYCGIVGLKPTYGRVSRYGVIPVSWSLDHCGPMARTVEDTAYLLQPIAGHDPKDPSSSPAPVPDYSAALVEDVRGLRIGVPRHYCFDSVTGAEPETAAAVEKALADLVKRGAFIKEVIIPSLAYAPIANTVMFTSEAFAHHKRGLQTQPQDYGLLFRTRTYLGALFTAHDLVQAQRARSRIRHEFSQVLQEVDVVALPTSLSPAPPLKGFDPLAVMMGPSFLAPFNQTGMPAISVPCGFSAAGLPIGLQIAGRPFDEPTVLRTAYTYQQHAEWFKRRPPL